MRTGVGGVRVEPTGPNHTAYPRPCKRLNPPREAKHGLMPSGDEAREIRARNPGTYLSGGGFLRR